MTDNEWALLLDTVGAFEDRLAAAIIELDGMEDPSSLSDIITLGQAVEVMRGVVKREDAIRKDMQPGGYAESLLKNVD